MKKYRAFILHAALLVFAAACIIASFTLAHAHQAMSGMKYDAYCCNGDSQSGDCQAIPASAVKVEKDGYLITILPGQHRLVTRPHTFKVAFNEVRMATDEEYHLCLYPEEDTFRCLYVPPQGS